MMKYGLFLIALVIFASFGFSQLSKYSLTPSYYDSVPTTGSSFTLNIADVDLSSSTQIIFTAYQRADSTYSLLVDGQLCGRFLAQGVGQVRISFDCTSLIPSSGTYSLTLSHTNSLGSAASGVFGHVEVSKTIRSDIESSLSTFFRNKFTSIQVHGTEYSPGEDGKVFVQVLDNNIGVPNATCEMTAYRPNNTIFFSSSLTFLNGSQGLYFRNFTVPSTLGVYMTEASCFVPLEPRNLTTNFGRVSGANVLVPFTETSSFTDSVFVGGNGLSCFTDKWEDTPENFNIRRLTQITNITLFMNVGSPKDTTVNINFTKENFNTGEFTFLFNTSAPVRINSTTQIVRLPRINQTVEFSSSEKLVAEICIRNNEGSQTFNLLYGSNASLSQFIREAGTLNLTQTVSYRGSGEIHVRAATAVSGSVNVTNSSINQIANASAEATLAGRTSAIFAGTEYYKAGDDARFWVQLVRGNNPETGAICSAILYNPFLGVHANFNLTELSPNGIYYANFTVPSVDGNYLADVNCSIAGRNYFTTGDIHVSSFVFTLLNQTNTTAFQISALANQINLTTIQTLQLAEVINITTNENKALLQALNLSVADLLVLSNNINFTVSQILPLVQGINSTTVQILSSVNQINLTVNQINALANSINVTANDILVLANEINLTTRRNEIILLHTNATLTNVSAKIDSLNLTVQEIKVLAEQINLTTIDTYNLLLNVNLTTTQQLALSQFINSTTLQTLNVTNAIYSLVQFVNTTTVATQNQVAQVYDLAVDINLTAKQILVFAIAINMTATDIFALLQHVELEVHNLTALAEETNLTSKQILVIANNTLNNVTFQTPILTQINQTNFQILAAILNLSSVVNVTFSGNVSIDIPALVTAIWQADVEDIYFYQVPARTVTRTAPIGIAYAAPSDIAYAQQIQTQNTEAICLNNDTLLLRVARERCVNGNCVFIQTNTTVSCQFECNFDVFPNECNPSPFQVNILFIGFLIVMMVILGIALFYLRGRF